MTRTALANVLAMTAMIVNIMGLIMPWRSHISCGARTAVLMSQNIKQAKVGTSGGVQKSSIDGSTAFDVTAQGAQSRGRRKMGPPQRKLSQSQIEKDMTAGRVSVFCVGAAIDIVALRAHVFRRGFGSANHKFQAGEQPELVLTRGQSGAETDDEEVLHVSNAPLYITTDRMLGAIKLDADGCIIQPDGVVGDDCGTSKSTSGIGSGSHDGSDSSDDATSIVGNTSDNGSGGGSSSSNGGSGGSGGSQNLNSNSKNMAATASYGNIWAEVSASEEEAMDEVDLQMRQKLLMATQDVFYFDYGCVVFWGLTPREERAALIELKDFTTTPVSATELDSSFDTLEFVFDRKANPQRPIRFDRMRLRSLQVEEKMALSYAMAQSSKLFVFESKIFQSLEMTRYLPKELAVKGRINSSKRELNKIIGQLFVEQTEVNLFSSILDTPDFLWDDDQFVPAYQYLRSYLEVDDRVSLLNNRLSVIRELLDVLTAQVADNNSARLEWIVIWLISIEIIMGIASNPLFAGRRFVTAMLVPSAIIAFKRVNWSAWVNIME